MSKLDKIRNSYETITQLLKQITLRRMIYYGLLDSYEYYVLAHNNFNWGEALIK